MEPVDVEVKFDNDGSVRHRHNVSDAFTHGGAPSGSSSSDSGDDTLPGVTQLGAHDHSYLVGFSAGRAYISNADAGVFIRAAEQSAAAMQALAALLSDLTVGRDLSLMQVSQCSNSLPATHVGDTTKNYWRNALVRVHCESASRDMNCSKCLYVSCF